MGINHRIAMSGPVVVPDIPFQDQINLKQGQNNWLINADFRQNSRAAASYNATGYTVDNWYLVSPSNLTVTPTATSIAPNSNSFIRVNTSNASNSFSYVQCLTQNNALSLAGKTATFSVKMRVDAAMGVTTTIAIQKNATANTLSGGAWSTVNSSAVTAPVGTTTSTFSITSSIPSDGTAAGLRVTITFNNANNGINFDFTEAILNIGPSASPFCYYGGSLGAENRELERYVQSFGGKTGAAVLPLGVGDGTASATVVMNITKMRTLPTLVVVGSAGTDYLWATAAGATVDLSANPVLTASRSTESTVLISGTTAALGTTVGTAYYLRAKTTSGILILTAELT